MIVAEMHIEPSGFVPQNGTVYAMICEGCGPIDARELAIALLHDSGFEGRIKRARFNSTSPFSQASLSWQIERMMLQHPNEEVVLVVSPGLGLGMDPGRKMAEVAFEAFMDELEQEVLVADFAVVLAFHTEGLCVSKALLERECWARDFVRVQVHRDEVRQVACSGLNQVELDAVVTMSGIVSEGESILMDAAGQHGPKIIERDGVESEVSDDADDAR